MDQSEPGKSTRTNQIVNNLSNESMNTNNEDDGEYRVRDTDTEDQTTSDDPNLGPTETLSLDTDTSTGNLDVREPRLTGDDTQNVVPGAIVEGDLSPTTYDVRGEFCNLPSGEVTGPSLAFVSSPQREEDTIDMDESEIPLDDGLSQMDDSYEQSEEDAIFQEYISLANLPNPPRRIPRQNVKDFVAAIERVSKKFLEKKNIRTLFDILRILKTVFDPFLTKRKTSLVREALRSYPQVELPDPGERQRKRHVAKPLNLQAEKIRRAESYLKDGFLGKAMRMLTSTKVPVEITSEVYLHLQTLYPEQDLEEGRVQYDAIPDKPDSEDIMRSLKKVNLDASGGPSGWNYRHLKVATRSPSFVKFLTEYSGMMAMNEAPGRRMMTIADGIVLAEPKEKDPKKVRPISMGEVIYQICSSTARKKNREPGDLLPNQLGSGTPGGVEPLIKIQKDFFYVDEEYIPEDVILGDRSNAFNTKKIKKVRTGLSKYNPKNGPLFEFCYGKPNIILIKKKETGWKLQLVTTCLRQGDSNSTYWFQIGDRDEISELDDRLGDTSMVWTYVDDVYVFNIKPEEEDEDNDPDPPPDPPDPDPDPLRESPMEIIMNTLENINPRKTKQMTKKKVLTEGYETLGGFIGPRIKRLQHLTKKLYELRRTIKKLDPLQKQTQLLLLRQCVIPTLNHTMRNVDPLGCEQIYKDMKQIIAERISKLADTPIRGVNPKYKRKGRRPTSNGYPNMTLVGLPVRHGGLGMGDQELQARIAWGASQSKAKWLINKWKGMATKPPRSQKQRMEQHWIQASNEMMRSLYRPAAIRVAMNAEKSASSWMTTIPMTKALQLTNGEVRRGLRSRLLYGDDKVNETKREKIKKTIVDEFKAAEYEATQTTASTTHTIPGDPNTWLPDSVVDPMAISVQTFNVEGIKISNPPDNTGHILKYYQKKVHEAVKKLQIKRSKSRYYEGYIYFPMFISKTGAFLGRTREWIKQMKQRSRLNKTPSPITQLVSVQSIKSLC